MITPTKCKPTHDNNLPENRDQGTYSWPLTNASLTCTYTRIFIFHMTKHTHAPQPKAAVNGQALARAVHCPAQSTTWPPRRRQRSKHMAGQEAAQGCIARKRILGTPPMLHCGLAAWSRELKVGSRVDSFSLAKHQPQNAKEKAAHFPTSKSKKKDNEVARHKASKRGGT